MPIIRGEQCFICNNWRKRTVSSVHKKSSLKCKKCKTVLNLKKKQERAKESERSMCSH
eukprot:m.37006 g.37006  ORF g.37006 m.37006 type:complete len:58 (-) comp10129_c1_seq1:69-242(-)